MGGGTREVEEEIGGVGEEEGGGGEQDSGVGGEGEGFGRGGEGWVGDGGWRGFGVEREVE